MRVKCLNWNSQVEVELKQQFRVQEINLSHNEGIFSGQIEFMNEISEAVLAGTLFSLGVQIIELKEEQSSLEQNFESMILNRNNANEKQNQNAH